MGFSVHSPREDHRTGRDHLAAVTTLLQRVRAVHPTAGLFEAADLQWWWRTPRPTDEVPQLFWLDSEGHPEAAVILTDWDDHVSMDAITMPDASPAWLTHVMERGLEHAADQGISIVDFEVDRADAVLRGLLADRGFSEGSDAIVESWLDAGDRPMVGPLAHGYRLRTRLETQSWPHHFIGRSGPDVEARLRQTSLYRPDLDLVVLDRADRVAAYGLFWYDPVTATGLVEPMRTEDDHQRRGLARHVLTAGLERLAGAGAERIKICYEPDNPASGHLYRSVGFEPVRTTISMSGPTGAPGADT